MFRRPAKIDQSLAKLALANEGIKARLCATRYGFRIVFAGDVGNAADILNALGFRNPCGKLFTTIYPEINVNLVEE